MTTSIDQKDNRVCFNYDDFLIDRDRAVWIVKLSNGKSVYDDSGRYGERDFAVKRLKQYVEENDLSVVGVDIRFRSHTVRVFEKESFENIDGLMLYNGCIATMGMGGSQDTFRISRVVADKCFYEEYIVPELIYNYSGTRDLLDKDVVVWQAGRQRPKK